jgi:putative solute:sodium symporter small subunit
MATDKRAYWSENLRLMAILLGVWFLVSFGFGIVFVDALNAIEIAGFKLGFWFAQQGSIFTFVTLIFIYVVLMNRIDRKHGVEETPGEKPATPRKSS